MTPEQLKYVTDLGGLALFVLSVAIAAIGLHRQWWVPGWVHRNEVDRRVKAEATVERLTRSVGAALSRDRPSRSERLRGERRIAGADPDA